MFHAALAAILLAAASATTWLHVSLGEPIAAVRANLGDSLAERDLGDGLTKSLYFVADNAAFLGVDRKNGVVVMISLEAAESPGSPVSVTDPSGIRLGDTEQHVLAVRGTPDSTDNGDGADRLLYGSGAVWHYVFRDGKLVMIILSDAHGVTAVSSGVAEPVLHSGSSVADAIVIKGENAMTGVDWEYAYLAYHPCANGEKQKMLQQAPLSSNKHSYDALKTQCPGETPKTLYFDITDYIGKL